MNQWLLMSCDELLIRVLIFGALATEDIDFWCSGNRKYWFFKLRRQKILIFGALATDNIHFWCSGDRKYWFLVFRRQKILVFGAPATENIGFWCPGDRKYWFLVLWRQKILIFGAPATKNIGFFKVLGAPGGGCRARTGADGEREILDPLNDQKSKKIIKVTKWLSTKWLITPLHAMRQGRWRISVFLIFFFI